MKKERSLYIIGANGFGRELESWLSKIPSNERNWEIIGYLDINSDALLGYKSDYMVVGDENTMVFKSSDICVMGIANPKKKKSIFLNLQNKVEFLTFISNYALLGKFNTIGYGSIICPNVVLSTNINIGSFVTINIGSQIGHDVSIDDFTTINANVDVAGNCKIENSVLIGSNSIILQNIRIAKESIIGIGSVLVKNTKQNSTYFGNPAKNILK